jgi:hypothetical protein
MAYGIGKLTLSAGFLALSVGAFVGTRHLEAQIASCGQGGGAVCRTVQTCIGKECVTTSQYYPAAPAPVTPQPEEEEVRQP